MKTSIIEQEVRLKFEYEKLYNEIDEFIRHYKCKSCDGGIVYPSGKRYCTHLLKDHKSKFTARLLKLATKRSELFIENKKEKLKELPHTYLIARYS
jgi:hypothetical protein